MTWGDVKLTVDSDGDECLEFNGVFQKLGKDEVKHDLLHQKPSRMHAKTAVQSQSTRNMLHAISWTE